MKLQWCLKKLWAYKRNKTEYNQNLKLILYKFQEDENISGILTKEKWEKIEFKKWKGRN